MNDSTKDNDCSNPENNSKYCFFKVANAFLLLFVSLLAIVLAIYAPRVIKGNSLGFDYVGVIVAILAALITVLITWQIWITISSKDEVKKATEAIDEIKTLKAELDTHKNLFNQRNLEIRLLIDAHAKLQSVDDWADLSDKYLIYADAIGMLIQSNVDLNYEQIENAINGLGSILLDFQATNNPSIAADFIDREKHYERQYQNILTALIKREDDIEKFRERITRMRNLRSDLIRKIKDSKMGDRIKKDKQEMKDLEKRLREQHKEDKTKETVQVENNTNAETLAQEAASAARKEAAEEREATKGNNTTKE